MSVFDGWGTAAANISKWFTPKERREAKLADLIKRRDALLDKQKDWTVGDSAELNRIVADIKRVQRTLDQTRD